MHNEILETQFRPEMGSAGRLMDVYAIKLNLNLQFHTARSGGNKSEFILIIAP